MTPTVKRRSRTGLTAARDVFGYTARRSSRRRSGMRTIDIHANLVPQSLWSAADAGREWYG